MNSAPSKTTQLQRPPRRFSRARLGLSKVVEGTARWLGGRASYRRRHLARGRFLVREEVLAIPGLPAGLDGFTTVHWSDLHAGPFLREGDLAEVVAATAELQPDLVALTGDLITHSWEEALLLADDLGSLRATYGVLGVFGNHDYKGRREGDIAAALEARGVRFLRNRAERLDTGDGVLAVVGLEDVEEGRGADLEHARSQLQPDDVELVLCHNPLSAPQLVRAGCAAVLSGHSHGTQIDLPYLRRCGPAHPGTRLCLGPTTLIVSRGLGVVALPVRIGAPSEIVVLRLEARA